MNQTPKKSLGNFSPFEVFFNRPDEGSIQEMMDKVRSATIHEAELMIKYTVQKGKCSVYEENDEVLVRYPPTGGRIPRKRYVLKGIILKRNLKQSR